MAERPLSIGPALSSSLPNLSSTGGSAPATRTKSHYRPVSTILLHSSHVDITIPQSSGLTRSISVGGLPQSSNMGLQFASKGRKEPVRPILPLSVPVASSSLRPTNKRSLTSIFVASDALTSPPSPSSECSDELPVIDISKKHVSYDDLDLSCNFVEKNVWAKQCNMKLHPYHKQVAYMQAYDPISLESDRYTNLLFQRLTNGSPSFHDYANKPPATVLDLGCGQGHWILHAANIWKNTEFVGFDIVDIILPVFETVENFRLVRGDFLNYTLPFPKNTFDLVRMANLSLCIPFDKWEFVLGQVHRVLTPGGRLELIDDDIYFPYGNESKDVEAIPASPLSGSLFGDERLEVGTNRQGLEEDKMMKGQDMVNGDPISLTPVTPIIAKRANSTPTTSDLPDRVRLVRSCSAHHVPSKKVSFLHDDTLHTPDSTLYARADLKSTVCPGTIAPGQGRILGPRMMTRSTTSKINVSPSSKILTSSCSKRSPEKVALLPPIRSITPSVAPSSRITCSPTESLQTTDTSPTESDASSIRTMDTNVTSVGSVVSKVDPKNWVWQRKVSASKNMETLFEKMLIEQYGIHPRTSEFMIEILGKVFHENGNDATGEKRVRMKKSFHVKLPSLDDQSDIDQVGGKRWGRNGIEELDRVASTSTGTNSIFGVMDAKREKENGVPVTTLRSRLWEQGQYRRSKENGPRNKDDDKKSRPKLKEQDGKQFRFKKTQGGVVKSKTSATVTVALFRKSQLRDSDMSDPVSPDLSAKAAVILGIPYSELSALTLSLSVSSSKESNPQATTPPRSSNSSAKAARRLGIPYTEVLSAAASLSVPHDETMSSPSSSFSPTTGVEAPSTTPGPVQHPGLLIWPDTYVPMSAGELEMHACKYIQTLLGCRPALEEFVAKFVDDRGDRFIGEEEFRDEIWDYECFRRTRFNWPSEAAEASEDDPTNSDAAGSSFRISYPIPDGTGGFIDANYPANVLDSPASELLQTSDFSNEKWLRPTKSSFLLRSSSRNWQRPPLPLSLPIKAKSKVPSLDNSRSASPVPTRTNSSDELFESMRIKVDRKLDDLVHLRSIRVFEGIKA